MWSVCGKQEGFNEKAVLKFVKIANKDVRINRG
jgi:hypothetical protein